MSHVCDRFIPFSGGPRKCVGDQFALLEATVALAIFLQRLNFELVPDQDIKMTTGATIHTTNVMFLQCFLINLLLLSLTILSSQYYTFTVSPGFQDRRSLLISV